VSRGLGELQRRICDTLDAAEGYELPLRELRRQLGEPDRSNLRRGIRGLLERDLVEESRAGEERSVRLTFWGGITAHPLPKPPRRRRVSIQTEVNEAMRALEEAREEERRRLEAKGLRWIGYKNQSVRRTMPGPTQERILSALWEYAIPVEEGLPVAAVKAIVGGDRSNTRRAIRTLLLRGQLDESENGERIRLSFSAANFFSIIPPTPKEPLDDERAWEILKPHQSVDPVQWS